MLDTAIAGKTDVLATVNFSDFYNHGDEIIERDYIHRRVTAGHGLLGMHARRAAEWLRTGVFPMPKPPLQPQVGTSVPATPAP